MPKGTPFSGEFKQKVIEDMQTNRLSYRETAKKYDLPNHEPIRKWERIYLTEGVEGLYIDRRGRKSAGRPVKLGKKVEEDLIAEVQRLRAENDYLKKLNALVSERVQREKRHKS
ncbi:transposase [Desulfitobacterium sp. Sab5]|uniref:transposase n=1 Tax=Desulfitobacterium nosdiversum TaxID=3375356 RepID=UPI003CF8B7A1